MFFQFVGLLLLSQLGYGDMNDHGSTNGTIPTLVELPANYSLNGASSLGFHCQLGVLATMFILTYLTKN
ncbi:hypothetical protein SprV_0100467400 [Sparganum proliferum]